MYRPSSKSLGIDRLLMAFTGKGRQSTILEGKCTTCSIENVGSFRDRLSGKEYTISGICQSCQDKVFEGKE